MIVKAYLIATARDHQRINPKTKLMIIIKRGLHKSPEVRVPGDQLMSALIYWISFASHSVCTTVAWVTSKWVKFVNEVWSTSFNWNCDFIFGGNITGRTITKADLPFNFTIFHCRMSVNQPPWPIGTTSVCWHTRCWYFCSCSSHKTIPSLR